MSSENNPAVEQILLQLQEISTQLNNESNLSDTFGNFKEEYYVRNSEVREDLRDLKVDLNNQKSDLNEIQKDVQEMKEGFSKFKIEIQPIIEFKQMVSKQVMKYSSVAFFTMVALTLGMNGV
jgi:DNA repair ATPase RecN|tara:strand:+ start:46 stop:411 length:366 start_codon:yes stop_codon:yes gene_type:complete